MMEMYRTIAGWVSWPAVAAILLAAGGFACWVLKRHIDVLKEQKSGLREQVTTLKQQSPDILARRLAERYRMAEEELTRLQADEISNSNVIGAKESELVELRVEIAKLKDRVAKAQEFLQSVSESDLVCPKCLAPLVVREYHEEACEYDGRDMTVDHEFIRYECGLEIADGSVVSACKRSESPRSELKE